MKIDTVVDLDLDQTQETENDQEITDNISKGLTILIADHLVGIMIDMRKVIVKREVSQGNFLLYILVKAILTSKEKRNNCNRKFVLL